MPSTPPPLIFITGANGFIGRHLIRRCKASGLRIVPIVRSVESGRRLGLTSCVGFDGLDSLLVDPDVTPYLVHLAGASRETKDSSLHDALITTTEKAISFAERVGVRRMVNISGFGVHDNSADTYIHGKAQAESIICNSKVAHIIFRCSYILGYGDELTPGIIEQARRGVIDIPGNGEYRFQPIYVEDLTEIIVNALLAAESENLTENLLGVPITFKDFVMLMLSHLGWDSKLRYVELDTLLRRGLSETDPLFSPSELAVLVLDGVGEPTMSCVGVRVRPLEEFIDILIGTNL